MDFPELRAAGEALLSVCDGAHEQDGAGFNGYDAPFARDVLGKPSWTPRQASAVHKMLRKYRKQLTGFGINYDNLPLPAQAAPVAFVASGSGQQVLVPHAPPVPQLHFQAPNVTLSVHEKYGQQFVVEFPFSQAVKEAFRAACKTTIWEPEAKHWIVPGRYGPELLAFGRAQGWKFSDDALFLAMSAEREAKNAQKAREEATKASSATDSDFMREWRCSGFKDGQKCDDGLVGEDGKHSLFPYQRAGAEYLAKTKRALLGDEPGLGKTLQVLAVIEHEKAAPALIICPASAVAVWESEIAHWMPGIKVTVAPEAPRPGSRSIHVTSYGRAARDHERLSQIPWALIAADEAHNLKNRDAQRTQRICGGMNRKTGEQFHGLLQKAPLRFLLSGTPVPNRPVELIQPLIGIDRLKDLGGFGVYASRYCGWVQGVPGSINGAVMENLGELHHRLRATCMVRRLKADVMKDLPPKFTDHVPMALANPARYKAAARDVFAFLDTEPNEAEALVQLTTLRRVAAEEKVKAAIEWIENFTESDEKLVVMGWHHEPLEAIHKAFPGSVILLGGASPEERKEAVRRFQNDENCKLFVGSQAAYEAVTLTAASHLAFIELPWKPGQVDQASDRIHRIGQTAEQVTYHYLLAQGTIDHDIAALIDHKRRVISAIQDGKEVTESQMVSELMTRLRKKPVKIEQGGAYKPNKAYEGSADARFQGTEEWA